MISTAIYVEINLFAALVLLIIMDHGNRSFLTKEQLLFKAEMLAVVVVLCLDALTWMLNGIPSPLAREFCLLLDTFYWFATLLPCYVGLLLCLCQVSPALYLRWRGVATLPIWVGAALLVINLKTGWIFTLSPENVYIRGPYFLAVGALPFLHMEAAIIFCLREAKRAARCDRRPYLMLALSMLLPLLGSLLQIFIYGLVTIWIGLTLSILIYYVYIQHGSLSTDALTGVNNRGRFDSYTNWKWATLGPDDTLYLIILDINKFKHINDTYGHAEGDRALILAAKVLKQVMSTEKGFLARIGGDEFAIVLEDVGEVKTQELIEDIHFTMAEACHAANLAYKVSFSAGYAGAFGSTDTDFAKLFSQADAMMYQQKHGRAPVLTNEP